MTILIKNEEKIITPKELINKLPNNILIFIDEQRKIITDIINLKDDRLAVIV
jgi:phospho-2-dehydro-3-deoxyheptonate aldolase